MHVWDVCALCWGFEARVEAMPLPDLYPTKKPGGEAEIIMWIFAVSTGLGCMEKRIQYLHMGVAQ